jgi:hypothetical protein
MEQTVQLRKALSQNDFRGRLEGWEVRMERCVALYGNCFEGKNMYIQ